MRPRPSLDFWLVLAIAVLMVVVASYTLGPRSMPFRNSAANAPATYVK